VRVFPEHGAFAGGDLKGQVLRLPAAAWGADVVQAEMVSPDALARVTKALCGARRRVAAGGITASNAAAPAGAGPDILVA